MCLGRDGVDGGCREQVGTGGVGGIKRAGGVRVFEIGLHGRQLLSS